MPEADTSDALGNATREVRRLSQKNGRLNAENEQLKREVADLKATNQTLSDKASTLNEEGTIILTGDDAKAYERTKADLDAYKALGSLDEVKTKVESSGDAQEKLARYERLDRLTKAAAGHFKVEPLVQYDPDLDAKETTVTVEEDGKQVQKTAYVVVTDTGEVPFVDHVTQKHAAILPALQVSTEAQPAPRPTVKIPFQGSSTPAAPTNLVKAKVEQLQAKANAPNAIHKALGVGA